MSAGDGPQPQNPILGRKEPQADQLAATFPGRVCFAPIRDLDFRWRSITGATRQYPAFDALFSRSAGKRLVTLSVLGRQRESNLPTEMPEISKVITDIRGTLAEFCDECTKWEHDFESILSELDNLDFSDCQSDRSPTEDSSPLGDLERRIAAENGQLLERQDSISKDLAELRQLVVEQTETFTDLLAAETR